MEKTQRGRFQIEPGRSAYGQRRLHGADISAVDLFVLLSHLVDS